MSSARFATLRLFHLVRAHGCDPSRLPGLLGWASKAAWVDLVGPIERRAFREDALPPLPTDPLVVLGHYRSGTTWLHRLLVEQLSYASLTNFHAVFPASFQMGLRIWKRPLARLTRRMGARDPIHDRPFDWDQPAEEDVALSAALHPGSPSWGQVFGRDATALIPVPGGDPSYRAALALLVRRVCAVAGTDRIVLKSPPQLARVPELLALFPDARFVFLVRDPVAVFVSSERLWHTMARTGLHQLDAAGIRENVLAVYDGLHDAWMQDRSRIAPGRRADVRYESLVVDPAGTLGRVSAELGLGPLRSPSTLEPRAGSERPGLDPATARVVAERWARWFDAFDYAIP